MLFSENIVSIACGSLDMADEKVWLEVASPENPNEYVWKECKLTESLDIAGNILIQDMASRMFNPLNFFWEYTGDFYPVGKFSNVVNSNCERVRAKITEIVEKRIQENKKNPPKSDEKFDFLNHMLSDKEVLPSVSDVVDEVIGLFLAASETTQSATITTMNYFAKNPDSLKRMRDEYY
jgi:hypothetical protein